MMDEAQLSDALRRATDDVTVPRDLVRHAERLGRERRARRARRRGGAVALAVTAVVLTGGGLVVTQGGGRSGTASSTSAGSSASSAASGSDAATPPTAPGSAAPGAAGPQAAAPQHAEAGGRSAFQDAACDPPLVLDGVPVRSGYATQVRAGGTIEVTGAALSCTPAREGARYALVLAPRGPGDPGSPAVLAEVTPSSDGSFSARVTVPATTPSGSARLSVEGSAWEQRPCPDTTDCLVLDYGADLDVLPSGASPERSP